LLVKNEFRAPPPESPTPEADIQLLKRKFEKENKVKVFLSSTITGYGLKEILNEVDQILKEQKENQQEKTSQENSREDSKEKSNKKTGKSNKKNKEDNSKSYHY
jgi:putative protein kinase ArgK-like GTPase of G3E family